MCLSIILISLSRRLSHYKAWRILISLSFPVLYSLLGSHAQAQEVIEASEPSAIEEVVVVGERKGDFTIITENAQKLVDVPGALGDPLSAVFSLPGVVPGDGGEPSVRGSSPVDNLYLVDFLPADYIFHDFSSSIFSEYILQDFQLYSAGFGPAYSGVTGAAFGITLREPSDQDLSATLDLSLLRSGIFIESALTENTAFYVSARKSFIHLVVDEQSKEDAEDEGEGIRIIEAPQDDDYQFKYLWNIADKHKITLNANGATDYVEAELTEDANFIATNPDFSGLAKIEKDYDGQNIIYSYAGDRLEDITLGLGTTKLTTGTYWGNNYESEFEQNRSIAKGELSYAIAPQHTLNTGMLFIDGDYTLNYDGVILICTEQNPDCSTAQRERIKLNDSINIQESAIYINDSWAIQQRANLEIGAQWYNNDFTDESLLLPRIGLDYQLTHRTQISARYGHYARLPEIQYTFPGIGNPELLTVKATHRVVGLEHTINDSWSVNIELYNKTLDDLATAIPTQNNSATHAQPPYINATTGEAMGIDLLINKNKTTNWYGWLAMSYGQSERTNTITQKTNNYYLDTPWLTTWVMNYQFNKNMDIGWRLSLKSGEAYTPIIGLKKGSEFSDTIVPKYGEAYSKRLPTYARLDIRYKWNFNIGNLASALIVDVINVLNRENIKTRQLDYDNVDTEDSPIITEDVAGLGILPAIGLRIHF